MRARSVSNCKRCESVRKVVYISDRPKKSGFTKLKTEGAILEGQDLVKRFGALVAVNHATLAVRRGEIDVLLGENGAGKSTYLKSLNGYLKPDAGSVYFEDRKVNFTSARDAIRSGIYTVYQRSSLINSFSVGENLTLAFPGKSISDFREMLKRYELAVDLNSRVSLLSSGVKQRLEVTRALESEAKVLLLDEPTSVLAYEERDEFFKGLARSAKERGIGILITTHKLQDAIAYCTRATVMRAGRVVMQKLVSETSLNELTTAMFQTASKGAFEVTEEFGKTRPMSEAPRRGEKFMDIAGLSVAADGRRRGVASASFTLYRGEIVGIIGIAGNGQVELAEAIYGIRNRSSGTIRVLSPKAKEGSEPDLARIGYVSDDPVQIGLALDLSIRENFGISLLNQSSKTPLVDWKALEKLSQEGIRGLEIKCDSPGVVVRELSGGNIQKVIVAREFARNVDLLILVHPGRGLDVHTTSLLYDRIMQLARNGVAVLLISEDVDEISLLADRIGVIFEGRLSEVKPKDQWSRQTMGAMMVGVKA